MRIRLNFGAACLLLGLAAEVTADERAATHSPVRLRVLTYNIHRGVGLDNRQDLPRIAEIIKSVEPDLVSLQEVTQRTPTPNDDDPPAKLGELTQMQPIFGGNLAIEGGQYGNLVLTRLPIVRETNHPLPNPDQGEPRGVLEIELALPEERGPLIFFATHFDHRGADRTRRASADFINERLAQSPPGPKLLAGDLNDVPGSNTLRAFEPHWQPLSHAPLLTYPADRPQTQYDYILIAPAAGWSLIELRVLDAPVASDHRPIFALLEWTSP